MEQIHGEWSHCYQKHNHHGLDMWANLPGLLWVWSWKPFPLRRLLLCLQFILLNPYLISCDVVWKENWVTVIWNCFLKYVILVKVNNFDQCSTWSHSKLHKIGLKRARRAAMCQTAHKHIHYLHLLAKFHTIVPFVTPEGAQKLLHTTSYMKKGTKLCEVLCIFNLVVCFK